MSPRNVDRYFGISDSGFTLRREALVGITTFATMSYIVSVQPLMPALAGINFGSVLPATCFSSALSCVLMGLLANYPFALAPGMGENFLFVFTVCMAMGFSWQSGLIIALLPGLLFTGLFLFRFREKGLDVFPECLKNAIGPAIGYGVSEGVAAGRISYAAVKPSAGRWREAHPVMCLIALALVLRYAFIK